MDATYQNRPFVIGADMNLRRIDAAIASSKKEGMPADFTGRLGCSG